MDAISPIQGAFRAFADPTRREILRMLSKEEMSIAQISENFDMTRGAIKKHLIILKDGELISTKAQGRESYNYLQRDGFVVANTWLGYFDNFWDEKLIALKQSIERE